MSSVRSFEEVGGEAEAWDGRCWPNVSPSVTKVPVYPEGRLNDFWTDPSEIKLGPITIIEPFASEVVIAFVSVGSSIVSLPKIRFDTREDEGA